MTAAAAFALGGLFMSCTHDDFSDSAASKSIIEQYEDIFTTAFGTPAPNQTWGFGEDATPATTRAAARAMTRTDMPARPTFRDADPTSTKKPTMPTKYKNTLDEAIAAGAKYAKTYQNYQTNDVIYINGDYSSMNNPQNTEGLTIYVDGTVTWGGNTKSGSNPTTFVVTTGSNFTLNSFDPGLIVYLAPKAILNLPNNVSFQNEPAALYMSKGSQVNASNTLTIINKGKLLNAGGTITAANLTIDQEATVWNEGTINVTNTLTITNTSSFLYNGDNRSITAGKIDLINNDCLIYNNGTVTSSGEIKLHNTNAEIINNDTLSAAALNMGAGGKMHNVGNTTISGKTDLTNSNSKWMNDGQYISGSFDVDNYSKQNYNNCKLTVNGNFYLNRGEFVLDHDASVICESFTWEDTSNFWLGGKSMLQVNGTLLTNNQNSGYGFRGYDEDYAVIQAEEITHKGNEQFRMSYYGNLYIATENHFEQWYKDAPNTNQPSYWYESSVVFGFDDDKDTKVKKADCPVNIPESECSPGFKGKDKESDPNVVRIIAEDLTWGSENGDFDFNDVVFDVELSEDTKTITITLQAAGGTLPLRIAGNDEFEVHKKFGVETGTIVNTRTALSVTKPKQTWSFENKDTRNYKLENGEEVAQTYGSTVKEVAYNLPVEVYKLINGTKTWVELTAPRGRAAAKVAVDNTYNWCDERQSIDDKYYDSTRKKGKFSMYVKKETPYDRDNSWYK